MEPMPYLKPLRADGLKRRELLIPAAVPMHAPRLAWDAEPADAPALAEPDFAPVAQPLPEAAASPLCEAEPADETALDPFVLEDDDEDEPMEDAVPTDQMPMPVCVPLLPCPMPKPEGRGGWMVLLCILCALAGMGMALGMGRLGLWL